MLRFSDVHGCIKVTTEAKLCLEASSLEGVDLGGHA